MPNPKYSIGDRVLAYSDDEENPAIDVVEIVGISAVDPQSLKINKDNCCWYYFIDWKGVLCHVTENELRPLPTFAL